MISKGICRARETPTAEELKDQAAGDALLTDGALQDCHSPPIIHKLLGTSLVFVVLWEA